jgi:RimJ/RimL family protein N-acetyltransferase
VSVAALPAEERSDLRPLLDPRRAGDALALYYALLHPPARTRLWVHRSPAGRMDGFLVRAQTGQDLFRPLITLRAPDSAAAAELLRAAFPAPQSAWFSFPEPLGVWILPRLEPESIARLRLLKLNPARLEPLVNIFVRAAESPGGLPRFEIRRGDRLVAAAGVNWQSADWAEIFVQVEAEARERGYGKSVCAALCRRLLDEERRILYAVDETNTASARLAEGLGFEDTGEAEILCSGTVRTGPPVPDPAAGGGNTW